MKMHGFLQFITWLLPTRKEVVCYFLLTVGLFLYVSNKDIGWLTGLRPGHTPIIDTFSSQFPVVLFWGFFATIVYTSSWLVENFVLEIGEDISLARISKKTKRYRWLPLELSLEHALFRVAVFVIGLFYTGFLLSSVVPVIARLASGAPVSFLSAFVLCGLSLHIYVVLARLLFVRRKIFS
ncbi:MAG: hypothetical protein WCJ24_03225 [Candidatus Saccharibacteria bacterium]